MPSSLILTSRHPTQEVPLANSHLTALGLCCALHIPGAPTVEAEDTSAVKAHPHPQAEGIAPARVPPPAHLPLSSTDPAFLYSVHQQLGVS